MNMELNKYGLIREIASRADFTIGDVEIIWKTFEEIVEETLQDKDCLNIAGLFKIWVGEVKEHNGWNAIKNEPLKIPKGFKIYMTPSRALLDLVRPPKS
jgi:nucleoid DNA-binding protein